MIKIGMCPCKKLKTHNTDDDSPIFATLGHLLKCIIIRKYICLPENVYYLEGIDECQVIKCNVIVIIFYVTECLLMILHEGVDLTILAL